MYRFFILLTLISYSLCADISITDLPGLTETVKPQFKHLSPDKGILALESHLLKNLRFTGDYGSPQSDFTPHPQLTPEQCKIDSPQSAIPALLQWFFPSPAGGQLIANQTPTLEGRLTMTTLGQILNFIALNQSNADELSMRIFKSQFPDSYAAILKAENSSLAKAETHKDAEILPLKIEQNKITKQIKEEKDTTARDALIKKATALKEKIHACETKIYQQHAQNSSLNLKPKLEQVHTYKDCAHLAKLILDAHTENKNVFHYPQHLVEWMILGYACRKATEKNQLLELVLAMGPEISALSIDVTGKPIPPTAWSHKFSRKQYQEWTENVTHKDAPKLQTGVVIDNMLAPFLTHPDALNFLATGYRYYEGVLPLLDTFTSRFGDTSYADCGETFLWNLMDVFLFNPDLSAFDLDLLKEKFPHADPKLFDFYENLTPDNMYPKRAAWSKIIANRTAKIGKINYCRKNDKGQFELAAGLDNALTLIVDLLNDSTLNDILTNNNTSLHKKCRAILDHLTHCFSRDKIKFDWLNKDTQYDEKNKKEIGKLNNTTLYILINQKPSYAMTFGPEHFKMEYTAETKPRDWRKKVSNNWISELKKTHNPLLLPFFASTRHQLQDQRGLLMHTSLNSSLPDFKEWLTYFFPKDLPDYWQRITARYLKPQAQDDPYALAGVMNMILPYENCLVAGELSARMNDGWERFDRKLTSHMNAVISNDYANLFEAWLSRHPNDAAQKLLTVQFSSQRTSDRHHNVLAHACVHNADKIIKLLMERNDLANMFLDKSCDWECTLNTLFNNEAYATPFRMTTEALLKNMSDEVAEKYIDHLNKGKILEKACHELTKGFEPIFALFSGIPKHLIHKLFPKYSNLIHHVAIDVNKKNPASLILEFFGRIPPQHHHLLMATGPMFHTFYQLISSHRDEAIMAIIDFADADALRAQFKPSKGSPFPGNPKKIVGKNKTPLHQGISSGRFNLLEKIILKLSDPKYPEDLLPLFLSMGEGMINLWWYLDRKQIPWLYDSYGRASYNLSAIKAHQKFFINLLTTLPPEWLADLCRPNESGDTPLHAAIGYEDNETIKALLDRAEHLPTLFQANLNGQTPVDLLNSGKYTHINQTHTKKILMHVESHSTS